MNKLGNGVYKLFAKTVNLVLCAVILFVIAICLIIGSSFNKRASIGFVKTDAIVVQYNDEQRVAYIEYEYKGDTVLGKFNSNLKLPAGHIIEIELNKKEPTRFNVLDTNLATDAGNNKFGTIGVIILVLFVVFKLTGGTFIKTTDLNNKKEVLDTKLKDNIKV